MENKSFIDMSGLSSEDWADIDMIIKKYDFSFSQALAVFMKARPGIAKVVGEFKDGKIIRDEISMDGVREFTGQEAWERIINDVKNNNKEENKE